MVQHLVLEIIGLSESATEACMCTCTSECKTDMVQTLILEIIVLKGRRQKRSLLDLINDWTSVAILTQAISRQAKSQRGARG